jgi:hypothetical protein
MATFFVDDGRHGRKLGLLRTCFCASGFTRSVFVDTRAGRGESRTQHLSIGSPAAPTAMRLASSVRRIDDCNDRGRGVAKGHSRGGLPAPGAPSAMPVLVEPAAHWGPDDSLPPFHSQGSESIEGAHGDRPVGGAPAAPEGGPEVPPGRGAQTSAFIRRAALRGDSGIGRSRCRWTPPGLIRCAERSSASPRVVVPGDDEEDDRGSESSARQRVSGVILVVALAPRPNGAARRSRRSREPHRWTRTSTASRCPRRRTTASPLSSTAGFDDRWRSDASRCNRSRLERRRS